MKRFRFSFVFAFLLLAGWAPCHLRAQTGTDGDIGIYMDGQPVCKISVPCGESVTLQVYALLDGRTANGITGAEYSIAFGPIQVGPDGTIEDLEPDPGFFVVEFPDLSATTLLGRAAVPPDPSPRGINLAWDSCQTGDGTKVLLEELIVFNIGCSAEDPDPPAEVEMHVIRHDEPSNPFFQCPLFTLCDGPVFTKVCLGDTFFACTTPIPPFPVTSTCSSSGSAVLFPGLFSICDPEVPVDLHPGSCPNCVRDNMGVTALTFLSGPGGNPGGFDPSTIDPDSVTLHVGELVHPATQCRVAASPYDGYHEMKCKFRLRDWPVPDDPSGCGLVTAGALTFDGQAVFGRDFYCVDGGPACENEDPICAGNTQ